jgi:glycosyltransferase involved in cell wall biosynthesis
MSPGADALAGRGPDAAPLLLTIVIPAYNESGRIEGTLARLAGYLAERGARGEIIVVDDGSSDDTLAIARRAAAQPGQAAGPPVRCVASSPRRGKGHALRLGLAAAQGERVLLCDADMSAPIEMLPRLESRLDTGAQIAIGSRDLPDSRVQPPQPWPRRLLAGAFRRLRRALLLPGIHDTQCGFKLLDRAAIAPLAAECREDGWLFDVELLALADARGLRIDEVAVDWSDARPSTVRAWREILPSLFGLLRLRRRIRSGR